MAGLGFESVGGLQGGYGVFEKILADRIAALQYADKMRQMELENTQRDRQLGQGDRRMDIDTEQFGARLGMDQARLGQEANELGERQRQFDAEAPGRDAGVLYTQAQTRNLEEAPLRAEAARQAEEAKLRMQHGFRLGEQSQEHGFRLGEIGARGEQARQTEKGAAAGPMMANPYVEERKQRTLDQARALKERIGMTTAGFGSLTGMIPGSPARNFKADLDALKANIAFSELAEMRAASKTGGALGQVSDRELSLLTSTLGGLDQGQSPAQLRKNIEAIEQSIMRWEEAKNMATGPANIQGLKILSIEEVK